jgi:hypothetical protein
MCSGFARKILPESIYSPILNATSVRDMSYTWRSILKGVEVIKLGLVWRISNGEEVNIWKDPWL